MAGLPGQEPAQQATWPATTASKLIAGARDAVLVDALMTTAVGEQLAQRFHNSGNDPSLILGRARSWRSFFGAGPVLSMFPQVNLVSRPEVIDEAREQTGPETMGV
jgi:hypothetical protein